jgi:hypothetical protein
MSAHSQALAEHVASTLLASVWVQLQAEGARDAPPILDQPACVAVDTYSTQGETMFFKIRREVTIACRKRGANGADSTGPR